MPDFPVSAPAPNRAIAASRPRGTVVPALAAAFAVLALACGDRTASPPSDDGRAAAIAGAPAAGAPPAADSGPRERYVSAAEKFELLLPIAWKGRYHATESPDSTAGARFAVEFRYRPDSGSKAEPRTLMVLRIFPRGAWLRIERGPGPRIAARIGARGDDVFALSLPGTNPYPPGTPEALGFDELIISIAQGGQQVHVIPR
jgi:hypothetical protein